MMTSGHARENERTRAQQALMTQASTWRAIRAVCDELQRTSYTIAGAVDLLDAGVLDAPERDDLIVQLRRRVDDAVGTIARRCGLPEAQR
jgi:hypothetical protein